MKKNSNIAYAYLLITCISCSSMQDVSTNPQRSPATDENIQCNVTPPSVISDEQQGLCLFASGYINQLIGNDYKIEMQNSEHVDAKRNVLSIKLFIKKQQIETVLGRGGLRIRYLRFLLNELSYENTRREYEVQKKAHEAVYNFTLVELNLAPLE